MHPTVYDCCYKQCRVLQKPGKLTVTNFDQPRPLDGPPILTRYKTKHNAKKDLQPNVLTMNNNVRNENAFGQITGQIYHL